MVLLALLILKIINKFMVLENKTLKNKISILINYYNVKDYNAFIEGANRLLKKNPNIDILWNILGLTYQNRKDYGEAEKKFLRALQVNPKNVSATNNLGNNYKYINNFEKAEEYFQKALKDEPNYISALVNYGNLKFELNKFEDSLNLLNRALAMNNKIILIHMNLSLVYQALGDFEKAINHLKIINNLDPSFTRADKMMSALLNYSNEDEHFESMQNKIQSFDLNNDQKIPLYFALSKAFEDKGKFSKSTECFEKGNRLKREKSSYSIDKDRILFKNIKELFTNINFKGLDIAPSFKKVIFILGMPRSGTTLVEQIISSHKDVFGAGELNYLSKLVYKYLFDPKNTNFLTDKIDSMNLNLDIIQKEYFKCLNNFNFKESFVTDKALLNFQWIGFIKILFPNSKIISCTRDPKENCLSIYKNLFEHEGPWCYDKKELSEFYKLYLNLMEFWETKYPNTIYNIKYENLVLNPNDEIIKLIDYLGIGWDENCLKFYENKNAIKTLSVNQARKKIYSSSLNLYKDYKPFLKEFSDYLE
tara:strand:- start:475 stop:2079 length:1605 start_codon:yes stop_codon:yes gene_type:complete